MARMAPVALHSDGEENYPKSPHAQAQPTSPGSSDKENRDTSRANRSSSGKRKSIQGMLSTPQTTQRSASGNKRQRLSENGILGQNSQAPGQDSQAAHRLRLLQVSDKNYYDPDQDENERRRVRKGLRDLTKELNDYRSEYLEPESNGLLETVQRADEWYKSVKQTSDATIDSRLLVTAADLSYKRASKLALEGGSAALDADEFVSKCISYMRRGPEDGSTAMASSQSRHRASGETDENGIDEEEEDDGAALNWEYLGHSACFPNNLRPGLSGFLLGPLSVQKRTRQLTQRRARQERIDPTQVVRPNELENSDLAKQETANLTQLCTNIREIIFELQSESESAAKRELEERPDESRDDIMQELMDKYGIADDGGIPLFRFCINPRSFGQTVENIFYVSFLIRDGVVGVSEDSNELPTLHASEPHNPVKAQEQGIQKHQAIFSLDFDVFEELIEAYDIQEPMIPARDEEDEEARRGATSFWQS